MDSYATRLANLHAELGIPADYAQARGLPMQREASQLVPLGIDALGRDQFATAEAARGWNTMRSAAAADGITLLLVSVFRSVDYQATIIRRKLDQGQALADILQVSAAPGYSEHHTGCAFDLAAPGDKPLEDSFEDSAAFAWLQQYGGRFGFSMSFPRNNPQGFIYEPWHWLYQPI